MKRALNGGAVTEFVEQFSRRILNASRHRELSRIQWSALRYYAGAPRKAQTIRDFAAAHALSQQHALQIVRQLRRKRLLKANKSAGGVETQRIDLTAAGAKLLRRDPQTLIRAAVKALSPTERRALLSALKRASDALSRPINGAAQLLIPSVAAVAGFAGYTGEQQHGMWAQSAYEALCRLA